MTEWQPIEAAPKGEWIVLTSSGMERGFYRLGFVVDGCQYTAVTDQWGQRTGVAPSLGLTHWTPLPEPPK